MEEFPTLLNGQAISDRGISIMDSLDSLDSLGRMHGQDGWTGWAGWADGQMDRIDTHVCVCVCVCVRWKYGNEC